MYEEKGEPVAQNLTFENSDDPTWFSALWLTTAVVLVNYRVARRNFAAAFYVLALIFVPLGIFLLLARLE